MPAAQAAGVIAVTTNSAGSVVLADQPLPAGRFTVAPVITAMPSTGLVVANPVRIDGITASQFRLIVAGGPASTVINIHWHAVQMTATSATG